MSGRGALLVVGGGVSGMTAAVEASEAGCDVFLVEKEPTLGGRVAALHRYFPKLCPPGCGLEINLRRLRANPRLVVLTGTEVESVAGRAGEFSVTLKRHPRFVNQLCTACNRCVEACPVERSDPFNQGLSTTRAIYLPHGLAHPMRHVIDGEVCEGEACGKCVPACPYDAIELDMKPAAMKLAVGAIIVATGWTPYAGEALVDLGLGRHPDVITNVMMERLAAPDGPTGGRIQRLSDGRPVRRVAFVQCAGSRDENHLPYCSSVCCLASLKQATYVREQLPEAEVTLWYIDLRAPGTCEDFLRRVGDDPGVTLKKGKVFRVEQGGADLTVVAEDILEGHQVRQAADLVVLASGMVAAGRSTPLPFTVELDEHGFLAPDGQPDGIVPAGSARGPLDVAASIQDATAAALRAMAHLPAEVASRG